MHHVLRTAGGSLRLLSATLAFCFIAALPESLGLCRTLIITLL